LKNYLKKNTSVKDVLFTGGDPMVMPTSTLSKYILPLLESDIPSLDTIRIGTKSLAYWPFRYLTDHDYGGLLALFSQVSQAGKQLTIQAHFSHPREMQTDAVQRAIRAIRGTGAQIRTQAPLIRHINDDADIWVEMWNTQIKLGLVPYYM
jgi:L-lysine 2,3-aminomutase